jgi:hypothetical protein
MPQRRQCYLLFSQFCAKTSTTNINIFHEEQDRNDGLGSLARSFLLAQSGSAQKKSANTLPATPSASPVPATWIAAAAPVDCGALNPVELPLELFSAVALALKILVLVLRLPTGAALELLTTGIRVVFNPWGIPGRLE